MIKAENGMIRIEGGETTILADLTAIIKGVKLAMLSENRTEEEALDRIAYAGKLAFMSEEELIEELERTSRKKGELN